MSNSLERPADRQEPSPFPPKWVPRLAGAGERPRARWFDGLTDGSADARPPDEDLVIGRVRVPRSLDPTVRPPEDRPRGRFRLASLSFGHIVVAAAIATVVAFSVATVIPKTWTGTAPDPAVTSDSSPSRAVVQSANAPSRPAPALPKLVVWPSGARPSDEPAPLGVSAYDGDGAAGLLINGLAPGSRLSAGEPVAANAWQLSIADLNGAMLVPPPGFTGAMELAITLRLADGTIADRKRLRLEWSPRLPVAAAKPAPEPVSQPAPRALDAKEVTVLLQRGAELIANGNIVAGRLIYKRAAEAGEPHAAFALAETYDPLVLQRLGVKGLAADVAMAQSWYEKARALGSTEAHGRLQMLARRN